MPTLTYPGVYIEEISSGVRPIEAASTSTAAFVGLAEMGPAEATRVTSWTEFQRYYGGVHHRRLPGPQRVPVLQQRRPPVLHRPGRPARTRSPPRDRARTGRHAAVAGLTFTARTTGAWGNSLLLQIEDGTLDPGNEFRHERPPAGRPDVVPATPTTSRRSRCSTT